MEMNVTLNGKIYKCDDWQDVLYIYAQYLSLRYSWSA